MDIAPKDMKFNGTEHFIKLSDGETVRVIKVGQGEPILLMHTIRTQIEYFNEMIAFYAQNYTVYAIDLPGHGLSSINKKINYDEPYLRKSVIDLIDKLALNNITLVGESIGATLALTIAASIPEKVKQVIAVNTYDYEKRYADGIRRGGLVANFVLWNFSTPVNGAVFAALENRFILAMVMNGGVTNIKKLPTWLVKIFDKTGRRSGYRYVERNVFKNWKSWTNVTPLYKKIECPVNLVYGENDWSSKEERINTISKISNAKMDTIPNSGHFLSVDNPNALQQIVKAAFI